MRYSLVTTETQNAGDPLGAIAALALRDFAAMDLYPGRIGPETRFAG